MKKQLGKLFFCGCSSVLDDELTNRLEEGNFGGVLLNRLNLDNSLLLSEAMYHLGKLKNRGRKFLVACDHEGGQVENLYNVPQSPGNFALGYIKDANLAREYALMSGRILRTDGFSCVFAPVLDLHYGGNSPVVGLRTFASSPGVVAKLGEAVIEGYSQAGIMSCVKHFPGHGRAFVDSHTGLPVVNASGQELFETDMFPFARAIEAGVPALMTAHIIFSEIDRLPVTISGVFLREILREELSYTGLIISDAVEMKALWDNYSPEEILEGFFNNGGDMLILTSRENYLEEYIEALERLIQRGQVGKSCVQKAIERVERATEKFFNEADPGFIVETAEKAISKNFEKLDEYEKAILVLPEARSLSQADSTARRYGEYREIFQRFFELEKIIQYPLEPRERIETEPLGRNSLIIDIVVDSFRNDLLREFHARLARESETVHVIIRDPADGPLYENGKIILTRSGSPVSILAAARAIKRTMSIE